MTRGFPRIDPLGEAALLVRFADRLDEAANATALAFRAGLEADPLPGVEETAPSLASVLVRAAPDRIADVAGGLRARLGARDWSAMPPPPAREWTVPCAFGGEDGPALEETAAMVGLAPADAVAALCAAPVRVLALGFAPGMPYLGILPDRWDVPRRTDLAPRVPEGALVVAVRQLVLFGTEAPTGWRQVARTRFPCFRPDRDPAIALRPGDRLRFRAVSTSERDERAEAEPRFGGATVADPA